jgi:3-hydroxyacyl-[acyl-carrier-protein] dehydratase
MNALQLDREKIMGIIPHRDPMLLIDEVTELWPDTSIMANFYVSPERDIFRGHFPDEPVLPGVYTVEILAQAACILLLSAERYAGTTPYFIGIDDVKFLKKIKPGDTIEIHAKIEEEKTEKAIATCRSEANCDGDLACKGKVPLAMR